MTTDEPIAEGGEGSESADTETLHNNAPEAKSGPPLILAPSSPTGPNCKTDFILPIDNQTNESLPKQPITLPEERQVLRRIDLRIIPWLTFIYILNQLDRSNLANAAIMNTEDKESTMFYQLGLEGSQYNIAVSVFFIGYVISELPSNLLLTKIRPSTQIARICFTWGICATLMAATFNFGSLAACRFFLGFFEGGLAPGLIFYLGFWYRKHERASRWAFIFVGAGVAGAFSGIIAYGVSNMNGVGGLAAWRWLFIFEGVPTILAGIACPWMIPDYPSTAKFLNEREREVAIARLPPSAPRQSTLRFENEELLAAVKLPLVWVFCLASCALITVGYAGAYFYPIIIKSMGFTSYNAQLLAVGVNLTSAVYVLFINIISDKIKERGWLILIGLAIAMSGWIALITTQSRNSPQTNYALLYLTAFQSGNVPLLFTYAVQNVVGATKAATVSALVVSCGSIGGAIGGQVYQPGDAPLFRTGNTVQACLLALVGVCVFVIKAVNHWKPEAAVQAGDASE